MACYFLVRGFARKSVALVKDEAWKNFRVKRDGIADHCGRHLTESDEILKIINAFAAHMIEIIR
jgi:hypothetical protein